MESIYFVVSSSDGPEAIYFSEEEAFNTGFLFVDSFDEEGTKTLSYKLKDPDTEITCKEDYTCYF